MYTLSTNPKIAQLQEQYIACATAHGLKITERDIKHIALCYYKHKFLTAMGDSNV